MIDLVKHSWPVAQAGEAMKALADQSRLAYRSALLPDSPGTVIDEDQTAAETWIRSTAGCLDLELEHGPVTYQTVFERLYDSPSLLEFRINDELRLLALTRVGLGKLIVVAPNHTRIKTTSLQLRTAMAESIERQLGTALQPILADVGLKGSARSKVLQAMVEERMGDLVIGEAWKLGPSSASGIAGQVRRAGIARQLAAFLTAYAAESALWIAAWAFVGGWALEGRFDIGWLIAWALLLLTIVPIHMLAMWLQTKFSISGSWLLMRLLMEGTFRLNPEEVRYQGVGQLLGRVLESEALQSLVLSGGLTATVAVVQLAAAVGLFAFGTHTPVLALLLLAWMGAAAGLIVVFHLRRRDWTNARLDLTNETIERMIGHRTRLAQQPRERWHDGEDESLKRYVKQSRRIDRVTIAYMVLLPRGWLIVGIAALAPSFVNGSAPAGMLAAQLGLILFAHSALRAFSGALATLSGALIAAERSSAFVKAARRTEAPGDPAIAVTASTTKNGHLMEMRDVSFRYAHRAMDAVRHNSVEIAEGDRVLLQGASGSGKSTWVALASGVRVPASGLLFLRGIDRKTLGARDWRRRVVASPQFHENHTFAGSLAYNLLLGRGWPPKPQDLDEAEAICRELGLGEMLDRMPARLMQMVGETGWQMSNGEKSRVYLARALLQRADLIVLDETFGALDPETAQQAIECVLRRAPALVCIAHIGSLESRPARETTASDQKTLWP